MTRPRIVWPIPSPGFSTTVAMLSRRSGRRNGSRMTAAPRCLRNHLPRGWASHGRARGSQRRIRSQERSARPRWLRRRRLAVRLNSNGVEPEKGEGDGGQRPIGSFLVAFKPCSVIKRRSDRRSVAFFTRWVVGRITGSAPSFQFSRRAFKPSRHGSGTSGRVRPRLFEQCNAAETVRGSEPRSGSGSRFWVVGWPEARQLADWRLDTSGLDPGSDPWVGL